VINEAVGHRQPLHDLGYRARDTAEIFDKLYKRLRKVARSTRPATDEAVSPEEANRSEANRSEAVA
jgi:hypothetical protein